MKRISILLVSIFFAIGSYAQITTYPYLENFDTYPVCTPYNYNTICAIGGGWTNTAAAGAAFSNWLVASGVTNASTSSNTGPGLGTGGTSALDHTTGLNTGQFVFLETSGSGSNNLATMVSPTFDFTGLLHPVFSYWYHMFGGTMGDLFLEVSTNGGTTWLVIDSIEGQQQTGYANVQPWRQRTVDLCAYAGQSAVEFRFRGQTGTSFTSDMSIDDVEVFNQPDDVAMVQLISPTGDSCGNTSTTAITFSLRNLACNPISNLPVCYSVDGGAFVNDTIPGPIAPGQLVNFTFSQTADFSGTDTFDLVVIQKWSGDTDPLNDTLALNFRTSPTPDLPATLSDSGCSPSAVTLSAVPVSGTIIWRDSAGVQVGTGPTYTTPSLTSTQAYFASATNGTCESPGVPALAVLFEQSTISLGNDTFLCFGDTILLNPGTIPGATYSWFTSSGTGSGTTASTLPVWQTDTVILSVNPIPSCSLTDTIIVEVGNPIILQIDSIDNILCNGDSTGAIYTTIAGGNTIVGGVPSTCALSSPAVANCNPPTPYDLGTGTGTLNQQSPFYSTFEDQRMQVLFLASELQAIGMTGGQITSLGFDVVTHSGTDPMTLTLSVGCTNVTSITGFQTGLSQVFTVSNYTPAPGGYTNHVFQSPYEWDGVSNLIVEICMDKLDFGGTNSMRFTPGPPNTMYLQYQDGGVACNTPYNTTINNANRPNTRFGFCNAGLDTIPLAVLWSTGDTTSNGLFGVPAGTYGVTVTDARGCVVDTAGITLTEPTALNVTLDTIIDNDCGGVTIGSIQVSVSGGVAPYSYLWNTGDTTQDLFNLGAGNYILTVTDSNNCTWISPVWVVVEPGGAIAIDTVIDVACFGDSTGEIQVTISGGAPPFTYLWSNGATTEDLTGVPIGTYDLTVTDSLACSTFTPLTTIVGNTDIVATVDTLINNFCFGDSTGEILITVIGGAPGAPTGSGTTGYNYSWSDGSTDENLIGVPAGTYSVTISDSLGCIETISNLTLVQPTAVSMTVDSITNVACFADSTGAIYTTPSGGTIGTGSGTSATYTYSWSNLLPVEDPTGIPAGSYSVTVTDTLGCTFDTTGIIVTEPPVFAAIIDSIQQNLCYQVSIGAIYTSVVGGVSPFSYSWSNGDTSQDLTNLPPGDYGLTVTDWNGCTTALEGQDSIVTIIEPGDILVNFDSLVNVACHGDSTGAAFIGVLTEGASDSIPLPPYQNTFNSNLTRGYWFTAPINFTITGLRVPTDVGTAASSIQVVNFVGPPIPFPGPGNNFTTLYVGQNIPGTAVIPVNIPVNAGDVIGIIGARGGGPMQNSYANANNAPSNINGNPITLQRLVYQASLAGGVANNGDLMSESPAGVVSRIQMYYSVGSAAPASSYTYNWSTGDTTDFIAGVPAGTYNLTVSDTFGCSKDTFVTITEPAPFRARIDSFQNVLCKNDSNGLISITMVGGSQSATGSGTTIMWSTGDTTNTITNLGPGSYTLMATDTNGCTFDTTFVILEPDTLSFTVDSIMDNNCFPDTFGAIYVTPVGGLAPYSYSWSNGDTSQDLVNVVTGQYSMTITDANGCTYSGTDSIESPPEIIITLDSITHVDCFGAATGGLNVTVVGGVAPLSYAWSNGDSTVGYLVNATAGNYTLVVTDDNGCTGTESNMIITEPQVALSAVVDSIVNATCASGSNDGEIYISTFGGTPPYTYSWTGGLPSIDDPTNVPAGTYSLVITDFNGCTFTLNSIVVNFDIPSINVELGADTSVCDSLTLDAGFFAGATYLWNTGATSQTITVSTTGTYWVQVTDACGPVIDAIQVTVNSTPVSAFGYWGLNNTISFQNQSAGTNQTTSYLWDFGDGVTNTTSDPTHIYTSGGVFLATLTVSNSCGTTSSQDTVYVVLLSLEDMFTDENFEVYPNPTDQFINIDLTGDFDKELQIELYDPLGRMVTRDEIDGVYGFHHHQLDVSSLASGNYLVRVTDGDSDLVKQIVVH